MTPADAANASRSAAASPPPGAGPLLGFLAAPAAATAPTAPASDTAATPPADAPLSDTFKDAAGRSWLVQLNLKLLADVQRATGVKLADIARDGEALAGLLFGNVERFGDVAWLLVQGQAEAAGVTRDAFNHAFDGATYHAATEALLAAIADFQPRGPASAAMKSSLRRMLTDFDRRVSDQLAAGAAPRE